MLRIAFVKTVDVALAFTLIYGSREIIKNVVLLFDPEWPHFLDNYASWVPILLISILCVATGLLTLSDGINISNKSDSTIVDSDRRN